MRKQFLTALCVSIFLATTSSYAATTSLGNVKLNINTPKLKTTSSTTKTAQSANVTAMKNKISALENNLASVSSNYQKTVNEMVKTLLPKDEIAKLQEKANKLKQSSKDNVEINIDIAEDGSVALTNALKSNGESMLKNLSAEKKSLLKKNMTALASEKASYTKIASQAKDLISSVKAEPVTAAKLAPELISLTKTSKESLSQVKNITKLTATLSTAMTNAGIK